MSFYSTPGRSVLAKSWAGPDLHTEGSKFQPSSASKSAGRDYPRPWLSGSKPAKYTDADRDNIRPPARKGNSMCGVTLTTNPKVQTHREMENGQNYSTCH